MHLFDIMVCCIHMYSGQLNFQFADVLFYFHIQIYQFFCTHLYAKTFYIYVTKYPKHFGKWKKDLSLYRIKSSKNVIQYMYVCVQLFLGNLFFSIYKKENPSFDNIISLKSRKLFLDLEMYIFTYLIFLRMIRFFAPFFCYFSLCWCRCTLYIWEIVTHIENAEMYIFLFAYFGFNSTYWLSSMPRNPSTKGSYFLFFFFRFSFFK